MDLTPEFITKITEIAAPTFKTVKDVHGVEATFSSDPVYQVTADAPHQPEPVKVFTLSGFADLVKAKLEDKHFPEDFLIHVENESAVSLQARVSDDYGRRLKLIHATPVPFSRFQFNVWHDQEAFSIAIASLFADGGDKGYVLNTAASLTNDASTTSEDDGFTQKVNVKAGLRLKEQITLKPRVSLAPFRTFPELDQPLSDFVLRARCTGEGTPTLMLVEADGGRWKVDAIAKIRDAMTAFGLNIPVVS